MSNELQLTLFRIRERVRNANQGSFQKPDRELMKAMFKNLGDRFPLVKVKATTEGRRIRLGVLMAMLGYSITSQEEVDARVMRVLLEVTNVAGNAYFTEELSTELQEYIASEPTGIPWLLPTATPDSMAVPYL